MTDDRNRTWFIERIEAVGAAVKSLPPDGPVRSVLTDEHIAKQRRRAETEPDIEKALWPPLLTYVHWPWFTVDQLRSLDEDVTSLRDHPTGTRAHATAWLAASANEGRTWRSGLFETSMKARALAFANGNNNADVAFDVPVPCGRNVDIKLTIEDCSYYFECTIITESDEDQQVHAAWLEAREEEPDLLLARPGPFDPPGAKGPSPYYDANRFYIKVFDKLQKDGDAARTQTSDNSPNLLLLSCFPVFGSPLPFSPALGWAFDELFGGQPNMGSAKTLPRDSSLVDISLLTFLRDKWPNTALDLLACPSRLSGYLMFNCLGLGNSRVNYNAGRPHRISHAEMVMVEAVFGPVRGWESLGPPRTWAG